MSLRLRKRVEEVFGWMKTVGGFRRTRYRGVARTGLAGYLVATAYNLVRMANLPPEPETAGVPPGCPAVGSARPPGVPRGPRIPRVGAAPGVSRSLGPPIHRVRAPLGVPTASQTYSSAACYRSVSGSTCSNQSMLSTASRGLCVSRSR